MICGWDKTVCLLMIMSFDMLLIVFNRDQHFIMLTQMVRGSREMYSLSGPVVLLHTVYSIRDTTGTSPMKMITRLPKQLFN